MKKYLIFTKELLLFISFFCLNGKKKKVALNSLLNLSNKSVWLKKIEIEKSLLASIIENTDNICVIKDLNLRVLATNQAFVKAAGKKNIDELIGKTDAEIFGVSEDQDPIKTYMADERKAQKLKKGEYIFTDEIVIYPDGTKRMVQTKKFAIHDLNNNLIATANISVDITDIKKMQQEKDNFFKIMMASVKSSFNLEEILKILSRELVKIIKINQIEIIKYSSIEDLEEWEVVYKCNNGAQCFLEKSEHSEEAINFFKQLFLIDEEVIIINNVFEFNDNGFWQEYSAKVGAKSILIVPVKINEIIWGMIIITDLSDFRTWTNDDILFAKVMAEQFAIAAKQAELYSIIKKQVERESLLRRIIDDIRNLLEIKSIKNKIVTEIGKALKADLCAILSYNSKLNEFINIDNNLEYRSPNAPKTFSEVDVNSSKVKYFINKFKNGEELNFINSELFIKENM